MVGRLVDGSGKHRSSVWPEIERASLAVIPSIAIALIANGFPGYVPWFGAVFVGSVFLIALLLLLLARPWVRIDATRSRMEVKNGWRDGVEVIDAAELDGYRCSIDLARPFSRSKPPMVFVHLKRGGWQRINATSRLHVCRRLVSWLADNDVHVLGNQAKSIDPFESWWKVYL